MLLAMCFALSACLGFGRKEKVETVKAPEIVDECYTVDLFTKAEVEAPEAEVPATYSEFLGEWGKGAWNDVWCHDLMVTKVYADGRAELFEMHAPYAPWGQPATAFRRIGRIDKDGTLRFAYGTETVSYRIVDGQLQGRRSGMLGNLKVELVRRGIGLDTVTRFASAEPLRQTRTTAPRPRPVAISAPAAIPAAIPASVPVTAPVAAPVAADAMPPLPVPRRPAAASAPVWSTPAGGDALPPLPVPRPIQIVLMQSAALPGS